MMSQTMCGPYFGTFPFSSGPNSFSFSGLRSPGSVYGPAIMLPSFSRTSGNASSSSSCPLMLRQVTNSMSHGRVSAVLPSFFKTYDAVSCARPHGDIKHVPMFHLSA